MDNSNDSDERCKKFYDREYSKQRYAGIASAEEHPAYAQLRDFIDMYNLTVKCCLEIGYGRGAFQDMVEDYTGFDISDNVRAYMHKPFF